MNKYVDVSQSDMCSFHNFFDVHSHKMGVVSFTQRFQAMAPLD